MKTEILEEVKECKDKTAALLELLRSTSGKISNQQIARLNDMAYRSIQKKGLQKKLDERALKNKEFYKSLDNQVEAAMKKFDLGKLRELFRELSDKLGQCPMSTSDLFEAMEQGTCMCLGLDVERSEACIADPSMLRIKKIIPTFMTAESFIDSTLFSLKNDASAHGGFVQPGKTSDVVPHLAMGLGRESITGVMPLYLFQEHWEIARRRAPPIYGLLCTLDVMGYAVSQQLTIPFKVLIKAIEQAQEEPTEMNKLVIELVMQTCQALIQHQTEFRKNLFKTINEFATKPEMRTTDVVSSIEVLLA